MAAVLSAWSCARCDGAAQKGAAGEGQSAAERRGTPGRTGSASIAGRIRYTGPALPPDRRPAVFAPECGKLPAEQTLALGGAAGDGVGAALAWIEGGLPPGDYPVPDQPLRLDQRGCAYAPRVFGIRAGQPLAIVNGDPLLHNVHALGQGGGLLSHGANAFNVAMPVQGMRVVRRFEAPQVPVVIGCDVHPWMRAFAGVFAHPFFARTAADGTFRIEGLPAGRYTVAAWHERLGTASGTVDATSGASAALDLVYGPASGRPAEPQAGGGAPGGQQRRLDAGIAPQ